MNTTDRPPTDPRHERGGYDDTLALACHPERGAHHHGCSVCDTDPRPPVSGEPEWLSPIGEDVMEHIQRRREARAVSGEPNRRFDITTALTAYTIYSVEAVDEQRAKDILNAALSGPKDAVQNDILATAGDAGYGDDEHIIEVKEVPHES